jgi:hypothetical protein
MVAGSWTVGSLILAATHHAALSGPYHRNAAGILAVADLWGTSPDEARKILEAYPVRYVASCPDDTEERRAVAEAPEGFLALLAKSPPPWLRLAGSEGIARVYEVTPH